MLCEVRRRDEEVVGADGCEDVIALTDGHHDAVSRSSFPSAALVHFKMRSAIHINRTASTRSFASLPPV